MDEFDASHKPKDEETDKVPVSLDQRLSEQLCLYCGSCSLPLASEQPNEFRHERHCSRFTVCNNTFSIIIWRARILPSKCDFGGMKLEIV
jgi:hypothetical protein